jgi:hypothetical protein
MTSIHDTTDRCWDELRAAAGEIAEYGVANIDRIVATLARLERQFEVPRTPEAAAVSDILVAVGDAFAAAAHRIRHRAQPPGPAA